jgi:hypothetical protein
MVGMNRNANLTQVRTTLSASRTLAGHLNRWDYHCQKYRNDTDGDKQFEQRNRSAIHGSTVRFQLAIGKSDEHRKTRIPVSYGEYSKKP